MFLPNSLHARSLTLPFFGDNAAAPISGCFFQAGRFRDDKPAQCREHLRQPPPQKAQEFFGEVCIRHGADMLSMPREQSNEAIGRAPREIPWGLLRGLCWRGKPAVTSQERISRRAGVRI